MIYSSCRRGFIVTIAVRLTLYISYITPIMSPLNPFPTPLKAISRSFFVPFHRSIWSPSIIHHHLNLLCSSFLLLVVPPTHCTYFTVLSFVINI
jgi:hypothetical protein